MRSLVDFLGESILDKANKSDVNRRADFWNAAGMFRNGVSRSDVGTTATRIWRIMDPAGKTLRSKYENRGAAPSGVSPIEWQSTDWGDFEWKAFGYYIREEIIGELVAKYGAIPSQSQCDSFAANWNANAPIDQSTLWPRTFDSQQCQIKIESTNKFSSRLAGDYTGTPALIISFTINHYKPGTKKGKTKIYVDDEGNEWKNYVSRGMPGKIGSKHQKTITVDEPDYEHPVGGIINSDTQLNKYVFFHFTEEQLGQISSRTSW